MVLEEILKNLKECGNEKVFNNGEIEVSYKTLYKYTKNLYNYIIRTKKDNTPIIVYGHKSIYMIACFLACSFAGIAYVPVDSSVPTSRLKEIINNINPKLVFAVENIQLDSSFIVDKTEIQRICIEETPTKDIEPLMKENYIYYVIFTSGSTGKPKGVQVTYKNLDSFVQWFKEIINNKKTIVLNQAAFSFDLSVADLYLALTTKSELVVLEKDVQQDYVKLFSLLSKSNAEIAIMTPSFADVLLTDKAFNNTLLPNLKTIYFCGEILNIKTAEELINRFPEIRIINSYGPTECTVAVTSIEIKKEMIKEESLPIADFNTNRQNANIYIVDSNLEVLKNNEIGEILICGDSVTKGYINNKEDSNKRFINFNGQLGYLTGDLGYFKDSKLYYKTRKDRQIKYKGYRIELSDIEENLIKLEYIERCCVVPKKINSKVIKLIGYVKLQETCKKTSIEIRKDLLKYLPEYMCPNIKILSDFPINNNGKLDLEKLRDISNGR